MGLLGKYEIKFINVVLIRNSPMNESISSIQPNSEEKKLSRQNTRLREENNLLKLKIKILYPWLTDTTTDVVINNDELEQL